MQNGRIYRKGRSWILDYAVKELRDGAPKWAKRSKKLAPVCDEFRTLASVRHLAADHLAPYDAKTVKAEKAPEHGRRLRPKRISPALPSYSPAFHVQRLQVLIQMAPNRI